MPDILGALLSHWHQQHLKSRGFKKERHTFSCNIARGTEKFNFQGSAWSSASDKRFYINVGIVFAEFADDTSPGAYFPGNHWAARIETLVPNAPPHWDVTTTTDLAGLAAEISVIVDKASATLNKRFATWRKEYLERRQRRATTVRIT